MPALAVVLNGQVNLMQQRQGLASLGKYFVATNPTPGTAVAYALQTGYSATANGLFGIQNTNAVGGPNIHLDYLKLIQTATAPATTTVMRMEVYNETGMVVLTTASSDTSAALSTAARFCITRWVSCPTSPPPTSSPVCGSSGIWPEQ